MCYFEEDFTDEEYDFEEFDSIEVDTWDFDPDFEFPCCEGEKDDENV